MATAFDTLHLKVSTTEECNFRCTYCYLKKVPDTLTFEQVDRLCALVGGHPARHLVVEVSGGDPTLAWPQLERLTAGLGARFRGESTRWMIATNALEMTAERWRQLAAWGFMARVSLDGDEDTYIRHRHGTHTNRLDLSAQRALYRRVLENIRIGVAEGVNIAVNLVVAPDTVDRMVDNLVFARDQGVRHAKPSPVTGRLWTDAALASLRAGLTRWRELIVRHRILFSHPGEFADLAADLEHALYVCGAARRDPTVQRVTVDAKGVLYADEFEEPTRPSLRIGSIDETAALADLPVLLDDNMTLVYRMGVYPAEILTGVLRAQAAMMEHLLILQDVVLKSPPAAVDQADVRADATPSAFDAASAARLIEPLRPGGAVVEGYRLTDIEVNGAVVYRFVPVDDASRRPPVALRVGPRTPETPAFAESRRFALQIVADGPVRGFDGPPKRLARAVGALLRRNDR